MRGPFDGTVVALRRFDKLALAILIIALNWRLVSAKPVHSEPEGEHANGQQRRPPAPSDGTARLNGSAEQSRIDLPRAAAGGQLQLGVRNRPTAQIEAVAKGNNCGQ
jgi:hypothetical protein